MESRAMGTNKIRFHSWSTPSHLVVRIGLRYGQSGIPEQSDLDSYASLGE